MNAFRWSQLSPSEKIDFCFRDYTVSVESSGGVPLLIPVVKDRDTIGAILDRADGLLVGGGPDVSPRLYGEEPKVGIDDMDYELDLMHLELIRQAMERGLPILAICRGIQAVAVAFGGSLYQDIPSEVKPCLDHFQKADSRTQTHRVSVRRPSLLYDIVKTETIWVNSKHHQAVKNVPSGFTVVATASDGVTEAVALPTHPFLLGVQWHPETTYEGDEPAREIFAAFVDACRKS